MEDYLLKALDESRMIHLSLFKVYHQMASISMKVFR
jgi:hypothetical protein